MVKGSVPSESRVSVGHNSNYSKCQSASAPRLEKSGIPRRKGKKEGEPKFVGNPILLAGYKK